MSFETIAAKSLANYMKTGRYTLIDLRDYGEYKSGHIPGAIHIPYEDLINNMACLSRSKSYILYCDRGNVSMLMARELCERGYTVLNIYGGMNAYRGIVER